MKKYMKPSIKEMEVEMQAILPVLSVKNKVLHL